MVVVVAVVLLAIATSWQLIPVAMAGSARLTLVCGGPACTGSSCTSLGSPQPPSVADVERDQTPKGICGEAGRGPARASVLCTSSVRYSPLAPEPAVGRRSVTDGGAGVALSQMAAEFTEFARALSQGMAGGLDVGRVVQFAARGVPGADDVGITLTADGRKVTTLAAAGDLAPRVDEIQGAVGEGPCLQALTQSDVVWAPDLGSDSQWPRFAARATTLTQVRCMLSYRLFLTGSQRGALNFYATKPKAIVETDIPLGAIFAAYASLALLNVVHKDTIMNLERALESNREIGVAMGILMAREVCTQQQAFDRLRTASQNLNRKLRDVAADVTAQGELPQRRSPAPN